ncbi:MAG: RICIN domain-containing protein, partial [Microcystaceae cyanobacterium]
ATGGKLVQGVSANTIVETITAELAAQITAIGNVSLVASGATAQFVQAIAPVDDHGPLSRDQDHEISFDVSWIGTVPATYEDQVFNGSLDVVADGEVVGGKTVKITVPLDEEIPMPRPDDVSDTYMLIHHVTAACLTSYGYKNAVSNYVVIWHSDPPYTAINKAHLWVLVKQTDNTYLIHTYDKEYGGTEVLYLQAPNDPRNNSLNLTVPPGNNYITLQKRSQTELQSWVLVPVSSDPNTYAIRPKSFPQYAIGLNNNSLVMNTGIVSSRTWGEPTFNHYFRLSKDYVGAT